MTKMIKLSLAAAVAVSALSTTASAGSLEDAIKGVTISGKINVEYEAHKTDVDGEKDSSNVKEYDFDVTANIPVNDMITAQIGFQADNDMDVRDDSTDANNGVDTDTDNITLTKLNFTAKTSMATVIVGKQKQPTPFLDDERGDGVVALIPAGPVTIAAGHFTGMVGGATGDYTNVDADDFGKGGLINLNLSQRDISALAVIGAAGPVNYSAWYVSATDAGQNEVVTDTALMTGDLENGLDAYSVNLNGTFGGVAVDARYSSAKLDGVNGNDFDSESMFTLTAGMKVDAFNLTAGYGKTNDADSLDAGLRLHGTDLTSDNDAKTNMSMELLALDDLNDADAFLVGASTTFGKTTLSATYLNGDAWAGDVDFDELDLKATYAMSKNFSMEAVLAMAEVDVDGFKVEDDAMALRMTYKF